MSLLAENSVSPTVQRAQSLVKQKDDIEAEIGEQQNVLKTQGVGMHDSLIDRDGFPRSDVDIVTIRTARQRIIQLQNDYKNIMKQIEEALHAVHAENQAKIKTEDELKNNSIKSGSSQYSVSDAKSTPFATINAIAPDSPAKKVGLQKDDKIVRFGTVHAGNFQSLIAMNELVVASEGKPIDMTILRGGETLEITLTPRKGWGGKGLLGWHVLPIH